MDNESKKLEYNETLFFGLLWKTKLDVFKNTSFILAIIFSLLLIWLFYKYNIDYTKTASDLWSILFASASGIFGIVIAALSVTTVLFKPRLKPKMLEYGLLQKFLFPFWFTVSLWCSVILLSFTIYLLLIINLMLLLKIVFHICIFIFLFALFLTVNLTGLVIRLTLQDAQIIE